MPTTPKIRQPIRDYPLDESLNCSELADALKRSRQYVSAMKEEGYAMEFGTMTTLRHARAWLREHPDFSITAYTLKHRGRVGARGICPDRPRPKISASGK